MKLKLANNIGLQNENKYRIRVISYLQIFTKLRIYSQNGNENNYHEGGGKIEGRFVKHNLKL